MGEPRSAEVLSKLVLDCAIDLFAAYGVPLRREPFTPLKAQTESESSSCGIIGFSNDSVTGSLLLVAPFEFLATCRPSPRAPGALSTSSSADWILREGLVDGAHESASGAHP